MAMVARGVMVQNMVIFSDKEIAPLTFLFCAGAGQPYGEFPAGQTYGAYGAPQYGMGKLQAFYIGHMIGLSFLAMYNPVFV